METEPHNFVANGIVVHNSQTSTRYVNYSKDKFGSEICVVKPVNIDETTRTYSEWFTACVIAERMYMDMLTSGAKPQDARSVLPTCTYSEIAMTANLREWRHFLRLRMSPAAHPDMQIVAGLIRDELLKIAPTVFAGW